jgi:type III secretory pathway component EscS
VPSATLVDAARDALLLALSLSLPVVAIAALVGFVVAAIQAATQIHDSAVSHLPRLLAVVAALAVLAPWMGREIGAFAERVFVMAATHP